MHTHYILSAKGWFRLVKCCKRQDSAEVVEHVADKPRDDTEINEHHHVQQELTCPDAFNLKHYKVNTSASAAFITFSSHIAVKQSPNQQKATSLPRLTLESKPEVSNDLDSDPVIWGF